MERVPSLRQLIDQARAMGQDALGVANDPEIIDALKELAQKRKEKAMSRLAATLIKLVSQFREFSLKLGWKDGMFVTEFSAPPFKPATAAGRNLQHVLDTAGARLRQNIDPQGVILALDESDLDNAVSELEDASGILDNF